jgi:hypothetical protein
MTGAGGRGNGESIIGIGGSGNGEFILGIGGRGNGESILGIGGNGGIGGRGSAPNDGNLLSFFSSSC